MVASQASEPVLSDVDIKDATFVLEQNAIRGTTSSSVIGGFIKFEDVGRVEELTRSEIIRLSFTSANLADMALHNGYISLVIAGNFESAELGTSGQLRDSRPTLLEVITKQLSIASFLACVAALWAFVWGMREIFRPKENRDD